MQTWKPDRIIRAREVGLVPRPQQVSMFCVMMNLRYSSLNIPPCILVVEIEHLQALISRDGSRWCGVYTRRMKLTYWLEPQKHFDPNRSRRC